MLWVRPHSGLGALCRKQVRSYLDWLDSFSRLASGLFAMAVRMSDGRLHQSIIQRLPIGRLNRGEYDGQRCKYFKKMNYHRIPQIVLLSSYNSQVIPDENAKPCLDIKLHNG